eukprot:617225-Hanusia_phi.AAC.4
MSRTTDIDVNSVTMSALQPLDAMHVLAESWLENDSAAIDKVLRCQLGDFGGIPRKDGITKTQPRICCYDTEVCASQC